MTNLTLMIFALHGFHGTVEECQRITMILSEVAAQDSLALKFDARPPDTIKEIKAFKENCLHGKGP